MTRHRIAVALAVSICALGAAAAVKASIPDAGGVIHGCYNTSVLHGNPTGGLRVIDTSKAGGACSAWETPLNWNAKGPTGSQGQTGAKGATGPTGPIGPSNAYTDYETGHDLAMGDEETIVSVTLPIGRYTLAGDAEFSDDLGVGGAGAEVSCFWNSLATVHGFGADGLGFLEDMPVYGDVSVTSDNTAISLVCDDRGPDPIGVVGSLIATKAGTVTPAS